MTTVNTNLAALSALKNIESTDKSMSKAMERLSSGLRINSAADDAAGSAIASKMESADESSVLFTITGLDMDGNAQTEVIKGPAASATVTGRLQFSAIHSVTPDSNTTGNISVGVKGADSVIVSGQLEFYASNSFTVLGEEEKSLFESSPGAASLDKLEAVNVRTRNDAINALRVIDRSLDRIHKERAKLGALMSRMEKAIDNLTNVSVNTEASRGRIRDANFTKESVTLTRLKFSTISFI